MVIINQYKIKIHIYILLNKTIMYQRIILEINREYYQVNLISTWLQVPMFCLLEPVMEVIWSFYYTLRKKGSIYVA